MKTADKSARFLQMINQKEFQMRVRRMCVLSALLCLKITANFLTRCIVTVTTTSKSIRITLLY